MCSLLVPGWNSKAFASWEPVNTFKHEACARRDLDKVLGLRQWDYSRYMNGLRSLDGSITKLTHCGISRSFPHSQLESPRFQDVALFTEKQFVRKGLPSHLPTLILHLILLGPLFSFSFSQVTYQRVFLVFCPEWLGACVSAFMQCIQIQGRLGVIFSKPVNPGSKPVTQAELAMAVPKAFPRNYPLGVSVLRYAISKCDLSW